ncbi:MAG: helix-turn-helix transcriptional regulator [Clostridia bacterium]|nr:helix-turn-helix transcriptional regulator [Clostridia bacterium]
MSKFGTILRDLRLERGFTQAEVGEGIGVSPQAVSKWENENGLPDVTQLIPLADYFGVTVDALLGHDPDKDEREILAHIERLEGKLTDEGNWDAQMEENRAMLRKYPKDCRLMVQMCRILFYYPKETGIDGTPESDRCADELVDWGEKVLRESTDSHLRNEAVRWLVYTLEIQGEVDKGRKYAEMMPPYELCRENLMQYLHENDMDKLEYDQKFARTLFHDLIGYLNSHAGRLKEKTYTLEERLRLCSTVRALTEAWFPDGDYDPQMYGACFESYLTESEIYVELDRPEDALDSLRKAVDTTETMKAAAGQDGIHTAPFMTTFCRKFEFWPGSLAYEMKHYLKYTGRDGNGIIQYFKDERAKAFAETAGYKEQMARFETLCGE